MNHFNSSHEAKMHTPKILLKEKCFFWGVVVLGTKPRAFYICWARVLPLSNHCSPRKASFKRPWKHTVFISPEIHIYSYIPNLFILHDWYMGGGANTCHSTHVESRTKFGSGSLSFHHVGRLSGKCALMC